MRSQPEPRRSSRGAQACFAALVLLASTASPAASRAGDPPGPAAPPPMEWRLLDVADLTMPLRHFAPERGPHGPLIPEQYVAEDNPLFAGEWEETSKPLGGATDVLDLLKTQVGEPRDWSAEGVRASAVGEAWLAVRAPAALLDASEAWIEGTVRDVRSSVTIDLVALAGDPTSVVDGDVAAAVARGALSPLGAARACGPVGQRVQGRQGGRDVYLADYAVEVAQRASGGDPVTEVLDDGVCLDARVGFASAKRIRLVVHAWWAQHRPFATVEAKDTGRMEVVSLDGRETHATLSVTPGRWTTLPSTGVGADGVVFAVRAAFRPYDVRPRIRAPEPLEAPPPLAADAPRVWRRHAVADLAAATANHRGRDFEVAPSNDTPPEPPELPEPREVFPHDALVGWIKNVVDPASWETEGVSIDWRGSFLFARTDEARHHAIDHALDALRDRCPRPTRLRAVVVAMPLASLLEYWTGLDDAALVADGGAALSRRAGARIVDRASLRMASGQRNASVGGHGRRYVSDYDVEIADTAFIGNPIVKTLVTGLSLDATVVATGHGGGVLAEIALDRATDRGSRFVPTPHGTIECPSLGFLRMHGSLAIPVGETRIVSANLDGREATVVLVSAEGE